MRRIFLIFFTTIFFQGLAQMPKNLIVAAENLNFREKPTTQSRVIDQLDNSELLETIELVKNEEWGIYNYDFKKSWIKVRRKMTGEVGYVFGKYVLPQNVAYPYYSVVERIQTGYWYGIHLNHLNDSTYFSQITPIIKKEEEPCSGDTFPRLYSKKSFVDIFLCSQEKLNLDEVYGKSFSGFLGKTLIPVGGQKLFELRKQKVIFRSSGVEERYYSGYETERSKKEKFTMIVQSSNQEWSFDLTKHILKFGESGYYLNFLGDLNNDEVPDFILQEATNHGGAFYFFMSNENGEIELQSISWSTNEC